MAKLKYTFKTDTLFKMLFVRYPDLLKKLVAVLLGISHDSIEHFEIRNPEMPPEIIDGKFCRLDISMTVDGQRVDLEVQVKDENDYPDRSLYYWARDFSTAISDGEDYALLPRTILISIVNFSLFDCTEFHSEFRALEVSRHTQLTDKMSLHYFELPKLPTVIDKDSNLLLWLSLFNANTEEDFKRIEALEVPDMKQAIGAYRQVRSAEELEYVERMLSRARHNEAAALRHAKDEEREKWQNVVAEKDAVISETYAVISEKDALIAELQARLEEKKG